MLTLLLRGVAGGQSPTGTLVGLWADINVISADRGLARLTGNRSLTKLHANRSSIDIAANRSRVTIEADREDV